MTPAAFKRRFSHSVPPKLVCPAFQALWWAKKGNWDKAHRTIMDEHDRDAAWVHAYLHRAEGDEGNAHYWYTRARRGMAKITLDAEWDAIVAMLTLA
jgi:hypothetical protein